MDRREFMKLCAVSVAGIGIGGAYLTVASGAKMMPVGVIASEHMGVGSLVMVGPDGLYYAIISSFGDMVEVGASSVQFHSAWKRIIIKQSQWEEYQDGIRPIVLKKGTYSDTEKREQWRKLWKNN